MNVKPLLIATLLLNSSSILAHPSSMHPLEMMHSHFEWLVLLALPVTIIAFAIAKK
ncbi:MAG: hypothetical protein P8O75_01455 [Gammaproteobacteria bacterium]|jgi:hypothetical protein|nr:hypothetical protein [Gammaproteobacteria bacterium]